MAAIKKIKTGLGNPAVIAAASSPAGQEVLSKSVGRTFEMAEKSVNMIGTGIKVALVVGACYVAYTIWDNRFKKEGINTNYPPANITDAQANAKANAIYEAMYGLGSNKELVAQQLAGLNYNAWIKVYNAFGKRKGANPFGSDMNLVEWLNDQFNATELADLRTILTGVF